MAPAKNNPLIGDLEIWSKDRLGVSAICFDVSLPALHRPAKPHSRKRKKHNQPPAWPWHRYEAIPVYHGGLPLQQTVWGSAAQMHMVPLAPLQSFLQYNGQRMSCRAMIQYIRSNRNGQLQVNFNTVALVGAYHGAIAIKKQNASCRWYRQLPAKANDQGLDPCKLILLINSSTKPTRLPAGVRPIASGLCCKTRLRNLLVLANSLFIH